MKMKKKNVSNKSAHFDVINVAPNRAKCSLR